MESLSDGSWNIEMPTLLDCLRKDVYALVSKLELPEDQKIQIGKLIEQIRLEETKYEQDIRDQIRVKTSASAQELHSLKESCSKLEKELVDYKAMIAKRDAMNELTQKGLSGLSCNNE